MSDQATLSSLLLSNFADPLGSVDSAVCFFTSGTLCGLGYTLYTLIVTSVYKVLLWST